MDRSNLKAPAAAAAGFFAGIWAGRTVTTGLPVPDPWTLWLLLPIAASIGLYVFSIQKPGRRRKRPDFRVTWRAPQIWDIERIQKTPAFEVTRSSGISSTTASGRIHVTERLAHEERVQFSVETGEGIAVPFFWREGERSFHSKSVWLVDQGQPIEIFAVEHVEGQSVTT